MRDIKFRAWDKDNKRWVRPQLTIKIDGNRDGMNNYALMQYTGLKDKNGVEIYEGDIQKSTLGRHYSIYVVKSIGGQFGNTLFSMTIKDNMSMDDNEEYYTFIERKRKNEIRNNIKSGDRVEVIGNIYENQELLKGDNENI